MLIKTGFVIAAGAAMFCAQTLCAQEDAPDHRLRRSAEVFHEIMAAPDRGIPHGVLDRSQCVVIVPGVKKAAFVVGGEYGRGFAVCRHQGEWGGPAAVRVSGGSFGAQIGAESTDIVLLVMNQKGMDRLASDKFTLGADASAAAGPVGRTAAADTDASMTAEILSYSRARGAFAGIALDGTVISKDDSEDRKLYGRDVSNKAVIMGEVPAPSGGSQLRDELARVSPGYKR
jgi:lipid-binding SYLF domain-containing protein